MLARRPPSLGPEDPDHCDRFEPAAPARSGQPVFLRFGRDHPQPFLEAIGNPRREVADVREEEESKARQAQYQAQVRRAAREQAAKQAAEREARRPVCTGCGAKFTDARWEAAQATDWGVPKDPHPHLCDRCKRAAVADAHEADDRQEHPEGRATRQDLQVDRVLRGGGEDDGGLRAVAVGEDGEGVHLGVVGGQIPAELGADPFGDVATVRAGERRHPVAGVLVGLLTVGACGHRDEGRAGVLVVRVCLAPGRRPGGRSRIPGLGEGHHVVDVEFGGVVDLLAVVIALPQAAGQLAAGSHGRRLDRFCLEDLGAGVAAVGGIEAGVPVLERIAAVSGARLVGEGDLLDGVDQLSTSAPAGATGAAAAVYGRAIGARARSPTSHRLPCTSSLANEVAAVKYERPMLVSVLYCGHSQVCLQVRRNRGCGQCRPRTRESS